MRWLAILIACLFGSNALASGVVGRIWEPDWNGSWSEVPQTGEAWIERSGERMPVVVGLPLDLDDRLVTHRARVELALPDDRVVTAYEDSSVVLRDWDHLEHELGRIVYKVTGLFRVNYTRTEILVEGTEFTVEGDAEPRVYVEHGRVRVRNDDGEVLLEKGMSAAIGAAPTIIATTRALKRAMAVLPDGAMSPLTVGVLVGAGYGRQTNGSTALGALHTELIGRVDLPGGFDPSFGIGLVNTTETSRFPISAGIERSLGPVAAALKLSPVVGTAVDCDTGTVRPAVRPGGTGSFSWRPKLPNRYRLEVRVEGGWLDGVHGDVAVGVSRKI